MSRELSAIFLLSVVAILSFFSYVSIDTDYVPTYHVRLKAW
jgi:hypothetical protein